MPGYVGEKSDSMATNTLKQGRARLERLPVSLRSRPRLRGGLAFGVVLALLLIYGYPVANSLGWAVLLACLASIRLEIGDRAAAWISRAAFWIAPLITYSVVEVLNYNRPWHSFSPLQVALNVVWYYLGALALYLVTGRRDFSTKLAMGLGWGLGMANHYLIAFRGRTLFPADLLTLRTAANVAGSYDYTPDLSQVNMTLVVVLCILAVSILPSPKGRHMPRLWLALPAAGVSAAFLVVFFGTDFLSQAGIEPSMWTTRENGLALNFTICLRYSRVDRPDGYSLQALNALGEEYGSDPAGQEGTASVTLVDPDGSTRPVNVIVIMNESFSDLSVIPGTQTNHDFLPFWRSLSENTVRGYAYSSVFGGTTANSEYEFLTGNTTAFLPAGTVPYHMYVSAGDPSLVSQMNALGYRSIAMHPYYSSGWNRIPVYRNFGFDSWMFQEDFADPEYMRGYITDQCDFENVIAQYENKQPGEPLFIFNVTMQNHSGYDLPWTNLERSTWLTGEHAGYQTVNQYLSLIYETDQAFQYLIEYFEQVDEPTMILMFGDHQPQVATNYYTDALGEGELDTATAQLKQMVPFLIWANYDIPEADGIEISLNYLSTLLVKTANLPMTGYQKFLDQLSQSLPVINTVGLRDSSGNWVEDSSALDQASQDSLLEYQQILYNNIFDKDNRIEDFYFLEQS